jgi:hypothetical protein
VLGPKCGRLTSFRQSRCVNGVEVTIVPLCRGIWCWQLGGVPSYGARDCALCLLLRRAIGGDDLLLCHDPTTDMRPGGWPPLMVPQIARLCPMSSLPTCNGESVNIDSSGECDGRGVARGIAHCAGSCRCCD